MANKAHRRLSDYKLGQTDKNKLPSVRSVSALGMLQGGGSQPRVTKEMRTFIEIYKSSVRPEHKGLTIGDFKKLFNARDGPITKKVGRGWGEEICQDMFSLLDKNKDGYVELKDFLGYMTRSRAEFSHMSFTKKKDQRIMSEIVEKLPTPRIPDIDEKELREVFQLWISDAETDGTLSRDEVLEVLAGRKGAGFNWMEAKEAVSRMFADVRHDTITFAEFANHLQDVMTVPYNHLMAGEVRRYKPHKRPVVNRVVTNMKQKLYKPDEKAGVTISAEVSEVGPGATLPSVNPSLRARRASTMPAKEMGALIAASLDDPEYDSAGLSFSPQISRTSSGGTAVSRLESTESVKKGNLRRAHTMGSSNESSPRARSPRPLARTTPSGGPKELLNSGDLGLDGVEKRLARTESFRKDRL